MITNGSREKTQQLVAIVTATGPDGLVCAQYTQSTWGFVKYKTIPIIQTIFGGGSKVGLSQQIGKTCFREIFPGLNFVIISVLFGIACTVPPTFVLDAGKGGWGIPYNFFWITAIFLFL